MLLSIIECKAFRHYREGRATVTRHGGGGYWFVLVWFVCSATGGTQGFTNASATVLHPQPRKKGGLAEFPP